MIGNLTSQVGSVAVRALLPVVTLLAVAVAGIVSQEPRSAHACAPLPPPRQFTLEIPGGDVDRFIIDGDRADFGFGLHCYGVPWGLAFVEWNPPTSDYYQNGERGTYPAVIVRGTLYFDSLGLNGGGCARLRVRWYSGSSYQSTYSSEICNPLPVGVATGTVNFTHNSDLIDRIQVCTQTRIGVSRIWTVDRCRTLNDGDVGTTP